MGDEFLGICKRCDQPVYEHHAHVMVVPMGRGRRFFHIGCAPKDRAPDQAEERLQAERRTSSPWRGRHPSYKEEP